MANINSCKECKNNLITNDHDVHLHVEIEKLKEKLLERENHIVNMETNFLNEANKYPNGEIVALREELFTWQEKYRRLYDAHKRVQRVNQGLEDKLLKLVDVCETEKTTLTKDVAILSQKLAEANYTIKKLSQDNDRYKDDVSLAIQFLQCKQSNFVAHKFDSLPPQVQAQVGSFLSQKQRPPEEKKISYEMKSIKVPIPTFPPTAMVYSIPKSPRPDRKIEPALEPPPVDIVSAAIMAKVLEERQKDRAFAKHCDTCTCSKKLNIIYDVSHHSIGTQTTTNEIKRSNDNLPTQNQRVGLGKSSENHDFPTQSNIVVKVQPNNFLTNNINNITKDDEKPTTNNTHPNVQFFSVNEINETQPPKLNHHHLCKRNKVVEKDLEATTSAKNVRYCSMRLQSGSKTVLVDNDNSNKNPPVLYTRNKVIKKDETPPVHQEIEQHCQSDEFISIPSDNSSQNQQRVVDWIQNNLDNEISSSDNSQSEPFLSKNNVGVKTRNATNRDKYAEMEENVKRFLFGESEFLRTVEIGKLKYKNFKENDDGNGNVRP